MPAEPIPLGTFGEASDDDLAAFLAPPIPFTLVCYERILLDDIEDAEVDDEPPDNLPAALVSEAGVRLERREFTFHIFPEVQFGPLFRSLSKADADGHIPVPVAIQFLAAAIVHEEREAFERAIVEYVVMPTMIQHLSEAIAERYGMRPIPPRSARRSGPRHNGRTTEAAPAGPG
jgi:hypothetical protein